MQLPSGKKKDQFQDLPRRISGPYGKGRTHDLSHVTNYSVHETSFVLEHMVMSHSDTSELGALGRNAQIYMASQLKIRARSTPYLVVDEKY